MKTIITTLALIITAISFAQVAIGKATVDGDGILDFENPTTKGILLPRVTSLNAASVPGTLYYDATAKKVKFKGATELDLSINEGNFDVTAERYNELTEEATLNGTVLGANSSTAPGVLVLESTEKALILPKMAAPHTTIKDPEAGMIAYDTTKKMLCVFNGTEWAFWGK